MRKHGSLLAAARTEIEQLHGSVAEPSRYDDRLLKELIYKIVKMSSDKLMIFGGSLTKQAIFSLSWYVISNEYRVNCKNLFQILKKYASVNDMGNIYLGYLDVYHVRELQKFLLSCINDEQNAIHEFLEAKEIKTEDIQWLKQDKVVDWISRSAGRARDLSDFGRQIHKFGVFEDTKLYRACLSRFLLVCSRDTYITIGDKDIAIAYKGFPKAERFELCVNILSQCAMKDLLTFKDVLGAIKNSISVPSMKEELLNELARYNLKEKYLQWEQTLHLRFMLKGDPDRWKFWENYIAGNTLVEAPYSRSFYIDFGDYVVVELIDKAGGPAYLYTKSLFKSEIERKTRTMRKDAFRNFEYGFWKEYKKGMNPRVYVPERMEHKPKPKDEAPERMEHKPDPKTHPPGWPPDFKWQLKKRGIYPSYI